MNKLDLTIEELRFINKQLRIKRNSIGIKIKAIKICNSIIDKITINNLGWGQEQSFKMDLVASYMDDFNNSIKKKTDVLKGKFNEAQKAGERIRKAYLQINSSGSAIKDLKELQEVASNLGCSLNQACKALKQYNKKPMKEKKIKLSLKKAREIYKRGDETMNELLLQNFSKEELEEC